MKKTFKELSKEIFGEELTPIEVLEHYKRDVPEERVVLNPFSLENLFSTYYYSIRCFCDVNVLMPQALPFLLSFHRIINFLKENSLTEIELYSSLEVIRILKYLLKTEGLKKEEVEIYARAIQQTIKIYTGKSKVNIEGGSFSNEDKKRIEEAFSLNFPPQIFLTRDNYLLSFYKTKVSLGDIKWEMFFYHPYQLLEFLSQKYHFPLPFKLKTIEIDERERRFLKIRELRRMIKTNY